ncbi:MAG TPA: hypothetical protein RMH85_20535 [Polyangiaceae bacterium LLY-WYZ-15_(1-7)]|nr:hypothetical protein [Sandaracinus sp.]HJK89188.1 hypothetical protein [Polyangiaceae bacterium LLY-WYZ-15_(1-7)]MBJ72195.1 hypothetical protein [Sandaracinus sp.]HJL06232.1 hypothetical protein [Polyangiaceae bacterium LLY-WYZ-15_(1-7)]HJL10873.1 hypothetical protein [Polyangiaceae bacterium LLY-WYZ-15_(1-7)]
MSRVPWAGLLLLPLLAGATLPLRAESMHHYLEHQTYEDVYYLPSPVWLEHLSLGHQEALADLIWLKALVYIGDEFLHEGDVGNVFRYADAILHLDPDFRRAYAWVGTMGLYRPTGASLEDGLRTVEFLRAGVERFPDDGELAWDLAATLSYELPALTEDPAERERFRALGADHMQTAARLGAGPDWLALTNATQLSELGRTEQAAAHLEEMYMLVDDEEVRAQISERLHQLRGHVRAQALERAVRGAHESYEADYPWVPFEFYLLLGDRPVVDATELRERRWLSE